MEINHKEAANLRRNTDVALVIVKEAFDQIQNDKTLDIESLVDNIVKRACEKGGKQVESFKAEDREALKRAFGIVLLTSRTKEDEGSLEKDGKVLLHHKRVIHPAKEPYIVDEEDTLGARIFGKKVAESIEAFRRRILWILSPTSYICQIIGLIGSFKRLNILPLWTCNLFWISLPLMSMSAVLPLQTVICCQLLTKFEVLYQLVLILVSTILFAILCDDMRISITVCWGLILSIFLFGDALSEESRKRATYLTYLVTCTFLGTVMIGLVQNWFGFPAEQITIDLSVGSIHFSLTGVISSCFTTILAFMAKNVYLAILNPGCFTVLGSLLSSSKLTDAESEVYLNTLDAHKHILENKGIHIRNKSVKPGSPSERNIK